MSRLNCKPGDEAQIIAAAGRHSRPLLGLHVVVLYVAPMDRPFTLPDGSVQAQIPPKAQHLHIWVCELPWAAVIPTSRGQYAEGRYVPIPDICLRRIGPSLEAKPMDRTIQERVPA